MMERKRIFKASGRSPEQIERERALREQYQATKPTSDELAKAGGWTQITHGDHMFLMSLLARLKSIRVEKALSLADVSLRSGIDRSAISRLENGQADNPTFSTLIRLAGSLGKRLKIELEDAPDDTESLVR